MSQNKLFDKPSLSIIKNAFIGASILTPQKLLIPNTINTIINPRLFSLPNDLTLTRSCEDGNRL